MRKVLVLLSKMCKQASLICNNCYYSICQKICYLSRIIGAHGRVFLWRKMVTLGALTRASRGFWENICHVWGTTLPSVVYAPTKEWLLRRKEASSPRHSPTTSTAPPTTFAEIPGQKSKSPYYFHPKHKGFSPKTLGTFVKTLGKNVSLRKALIINAVSSENNSDKYL